MLSQTIAMAAILLLLPFLHHFVSRFPFTSMLDACTRVIVPFIGFSIHVFLLLSDRAI